MGPLPLFPLPKCIHSTEVVNWILVYLSYTYADFLIAARNLERVRIPKHRDICVSVRSVQTQHMRAGWGQGILTLSSLHDPHTHHFSNPKFLSSQESGGGRQGSKRFDSCEESEGGKQESSKRFDPCFSPPLSCEESAFPLHFPRKTWRGKAGIKALWSLPSPSTFLQRKKFWVRKVEGLMHGASYICLLYTSPSPRD